MGESEKSAPKAPTAEKTKTPDGAAPAHVPFHPPRVAGEWVLGPNGPERKE